MESCNANLELLDISNNCKYWLQLQLLASSTEGGHMGNWHSGWISLLMGSFEVIYCETRDCLCSFLFRIFHVYDIFSNRMWTQGQGQLCFTGKHVESTSLDLVVNLYCMIVSLKRDSNLKSNFIILLLFGAGVAGWIWLVSVRKEGEALSRRFWFTSNRYPYPHRFKMTASPSSFSICLKGCGWQLYLVTVRNGR